MTNPELRSVKLSQLVFDEVIYPRKGHDPILVQRYAEVLDEIEASQKFISVSSDLKLLDGKHRWLAYKKHNGGEDCEIQVLVYPVSTPHEQLQLAAKLNSEHGWQLTDEDKETTAKTLYSYGLSYEAIASTLSVGKKRVSDWLARTVKENKDRRNAKIFDLWMRCHSQQEIAESCECAQPTVNEVLSEKFLETKSIKPEAQHLTDFEPPIYNVWKQQNKTIGSSHFGNLNELDLRKHHPEKVPTQLRLAQGCTP